jgi:hypothetical protein
MPLAKTAPHSCSGSGSDSSGTEFTGKKKRLKEHASSSPVWQWEKDASVFYKIGSHFTCFNGTKGQIVVEY